MWNSTVSAGTNVACLKAQAGIDPWKCLIAQYALPYIKTPFFLMNSAVDSWQITKILGVQCTPPQCSQKDFEHMERHRELLVGALAPVTTSASNGCYINSCYQHQFLDFYCVPGQNEPGCSAWLGQAVHGVTPQQAFLQYYMSSGKNWSASNFIVDMSPWRLTSSCAFPKVAPHQGNDVKNMDFFLRACEQRQTAQATKAKTPTATTRQPLPSLEVHTSERIITNLTTTPATSATNWQFQWLTLGAMALGFFAGLSLSCTVGNVCQSKSHLDSYSNVQSIS